MSFPEFTAFLREFVHSFFVVETPGEKTRRIGRRQRNTYWRRYLNAEGWLSNKRAAVSRFMFYSVPGFFWRYTFQRWVYIKHDFEGYKIEYNNLKFLYANRHKFEILVPRPYFSITFRRGPYLGEYLFMSRINGHGLDKDWPNLSHAEKTKIVIQLRRYIKNLRNLKPPAHDTMIGSFIGGPVFCHRIHEFYPVGPFLDEVHLNHHLRGPPTRNSFSAHVLRAHQKRHELCLTHNDLFPRNIMVDDELNVVAIVDWKTSGWFPAHFEYCMCRNWANRDWDGDWKEWVDQFLDSTWKEEEEADREVQQLIHWYTRINPDSEDGSGYEFYYPVHGYPEA